MSGVRHSPKQALMVGSAWMVASRWSMKGLGFLSTLIMARLVLPSDYGIVAMAFLALGFIQAFLDFSVATALLRKDKLTREEIDSAWTLRILQSLIISVILLISCQQAANYFEEPRVVYVLWTLSVCVIFAGAGNIGLVLAQKELDFSLEFRHQVLCRFLSVSATVASGFWLRDYRALVIGISTAYVSGFIFSYAMHPYRPRICTRYMQEIWGVTKWLTLAGMGAYVVRKGDELVAARIGSTADYGLYNVGADLGQLPSAEVGPVILRAFLPVLASMEGGIEEVNAVVVKVLGAMNTLTLPIGVGFSAVAAPATLLMLGPEWTDATPFVTYFALLGALQIVFTPLNTLLTLRGHTKIQGKVVWLELSVFVPVAFLLVPSQFLLGLVWARMVASLASQLLTVHATRRLCGLSIRDVVRAVWRPMIGSVLMYAVVSQVVREVSGDVWRLLAGIMIGAVFFSVWTVVSWWLVGRPGGLETTVYSAVRQVWQRRLIRHSGAAKK